MSESHCAPALQMFRAPNSVRSNEIMLMEHIEDPVYATNTSLCVLPKIAIDSTTDNLQIFDDATHCATNDLQQRSPLLDVKSEPTATQSPTICHQFAAPSRNIYHCELTPLGYIANNHQLPVGSFTKTVTANNPETPMPSSHFIQNPELYRNGQTNTWTHSPFANGLAVINDRSCPCKNAFPTENQMQMETAPLLAGGDLPWMQVTRNNMPALAIQYGRTSSIQSLSQYFQQETTQHLPPISTKAFDSLSNLQCSSQQPLTFIANQPSLSNCAWNISTGSTSTNIPYISNLYYSI
jgi:hypothetical protein